MIPGWHPSLSPGPSRVSRHPVVPEPVLEPRRHPGILAGLPLTPCAVNRDQLHCQECPARAACMTDEDASATAIQEDPVRGNHERAFASCLRRVQLHAEDALLRSGTEVGKDGT